MDGIRRPRIVAAGILAASLFATALPAFAAPSLNTPAGVAAAIAPGSTTTVRVSWNDVSRETGYTVERSLSASSGFAALSPAAPQNAVSYNDTGRAPGTTYFYRVRAFGNKNATSPYSTVVSIKTPAGTDTTAPTPAPAVSFSSVSCNALTVSWTASNDPESGINRYELTRNGGTASVVTAPSNRTDTGLAASTAYTYTVKAINGAGLSTSGSNTVTTPSCPPPTDTTPPTPAPTVSLTNVTCNSLTVNWTASSDPESGINHYELTRNGGAASVVTAPSSRTDTGLAASTTYAYAIKAVNGAGLSTTGTNSVTTPACPTTGNPGDVIWRQARGGTGSDNGRAVAVDGGGNIVMAGSFTGTANFGSGPLTANGQQSDIFIAKYNAAGAPVWSKRFGGSGIDTAYGVAIDRSANCDGAGGTNCIVITGMFSGTTNLGGADFTSAGSYDIVLAKYSSSGAHLWSKRFGNSGDDIGQGVAVDSSGNVYLTGVAYSTDFGGGELRGMFYDQDAIVAKFSPTGAYIWAKNWWNTSRDWANAIAIDANGDLAITGMFFGSMNFGTGQINAGSKEDVFVAKLSGSDGHAFWAKKFGGGDADRGFAVGFDHSGNVLAAGTIYNGTATFGSQQITSGYMQVGFLAKLAGGDGAAMWAKRIGNPDVPGAFHNATAAGIAVDANDNVSLTGWFDGSVDFGGGALTAAGNGGTYSDSFVANYTKDGGYRWAKRFGGNDSEVGNAVALDAATNDVIATGAFGLSGDFGGGTLTSAGGSDAYLVRMRS